jgi:hypothetical protein
MRRRRESQHRAVLCQRSSDTDFALRQIRRLPAGLMLVGRHREEDNIYHLKESWKGQQPNVP